MSSNHPANLIVLKQLDNEYNNEYKIMVNYDHFKVFETTITREEFNSQFIDIEQLEKIHKKELLIPDMKFGFDYEEFGETQTPENYGLNMHIHASLKNPLLKELKETITIKLSFKYSREKEYNRFMNDENAIDIDLATESNIYSTKYINLNGVYTDLTKNSTDRLTKSVNLEPLEKIYIDIHDINGYRLYYCKNENWSNCVNKNMHVSVLSTDKFRNYFNVMRKDMNRKYDLPYELPHELTDIDMMKTLMDLIGQDYTVMTIKNCHKTPYGWQTHGKQFVFTVKPKKDNSRVDLFNSVELLKLESNEKKKTYEVLETFGYFGDTQYKFVKF